jgi:tetratricopeptide (TPR) repeat protein
VRVERSLDHAHRLLRAGRAVEAGRVLKAVLEERPTSAEALTVLFDVTGELGETESFLPFAAEAASRTGTGQAVVQELWVRGLLRAGRVDEARSVAERWLEEREREPRAYASLGAVHTARGRLGRAIESLERGRRRVGVDTLFRDELVALYTQTGRFEALVEEWLGRLAERPPDLAAVHREITGLEEQGPALKTLWSAATELNGEPDTQHSVALLALRLGEPVSARRILRLALPSLPKDRASVALAAYVREAEAATLVAEAAWGALRLTEVAASPRERWHWLATAGERALEAGDTARALASAERLVSEAPPASEAATVARERLVKLLAARPSGIDAATRHLEMYGRTHADSGMNIAELTLAVAGGHLRAGRRAIACELLRAAPVGTGPARHVLDAALAGLELQRGDAASALGLLRSAAAGEGVPQDERTRWIALLAVLQAADSSEVARLGGVLAAAAAAPPVPTPFDPAELLAEWTGRPAAAGRAATLGYLARELEANGRMDAALAVHETLVRDLPDSPEAAAAMLALARRALSDDPAGGRMWLERLVTRFPDSAVAPLARRLLAELSGRAPAGT